MRTPYSMGRLGTTVLGTALVAGLAYAAIGSVGCTITTSDASKSDAAVDTYVPPVTDTGVLPPVDTGVDMGVPGAFGVVIQAKDLIGSTLSDDVRAFGGGSSYADIVDNGKIAYALAKVGTTESTPIGVDAAGTYVDAKFTGLTAGTSVSIEVTGYLRGLNGNAADKPMTRIPWAKTTCTAIPSATSDVIATCTKLQLITTLSGVLVSGDVLPTGYCTGKGATDFEALRARVPAELTAAASKSTDDCLGVIWFPETEFSSAEAAGKSEWRLALESKSSATACTLTAPCKVDRKTGAAKVDIYVIGKECQLNPGTASPTGCF